MEFKIDNIYVFGLENAVRASGNPMRTEIIQPGQEDLPKGLKRARNLASTQMGQGHDNFLNGIVVQFDIYAPLYMWKQLQRYHFLDFISSQSTMHCITKFDITKQCNKYVWKSTQKRLALLVKKLNESGGENKELWYEIISNVPSGFILGATMTTNYRQLKTIYNQRKNHKLKEWHEFCNIMEEKLPKFKELIEGENYEKQ